MFYYIYIKYNTISFLFFLFVFFAVVFLYTKVSKIY